MQVQEEPFVILFVGEGTSKLSNMRFATERLSAARVSKPNSVLRSPLQQRGYKLCSDFDVLMTFQTRRRLLTSAFLMDNKFL